MDKVKHALGLDKSGSGGAQGMGDNRTDGHNTYDSKAGGTGITTARDVQASTANPAYDPNTSVGARAGLNNNIYDDAPGQGDHATRSSYNSNAGVGMTNAATIGTAPGYQEHHAHHDKHHGHHTASGAAAGALAGHHEGHTATGAVGGAAVGHELGERGQHGHHHQEGHQKEGMLHKIEAKMGMTPEQREAKKLDKELEHGESGQHGRAHHGAAATSANPVPVENVRTQAGGFVGQPDNHGNVY